MSNWQEELDETFPYGGSFTLVEDVPEGVGHDDSPTFLTPRLVVTEDADHPTITVQALEFDKDVSFVLEKLEQISPGVWLLHTPDGENDFLLSLNLDPAVRDSLRKARREWYEES